MYKGKKIVKKLSLLLTVLMTIMLLIPVVSANTTGGAGSPANSAVQFLCNDYTTNGVNNSDGGVGSYALYVLNQADVDVSTWEYIGEDLKDAVLSEVYGDIANAADPSKASAKLLAQDLAAAKSLGRDDLADQLVQVLKNRQSSTGFDSNLYSDIPAYDLLGRVDSVGEINIDYAKESILGAQNTTAGDQNYGSFGGTFGGTFYPDFMTTAEAVRALNYLDPDKSDSQVQNAIDDGCSWLKSQQQADGSFNVGGWDDPVIDTAEVIVALKTLGMDTADWESSEGETAVDYLMNNALNADGSFGTSKNIMDATWALCAYNLLETQFYLDPSSATLNVGGTEQLEAVWQNTYGTTDVTQYAQWSVADSSIAGVDNSGLVTALEAGQTVVKAVYGGLTASAALTVNSSSSGGGGSGTEKTVGLAVVGMNNELLYGPSEVTVYETNKWGLTALGALDASGISYHTSSWSYGYLVDSIDGQANSGLAGWMYVVNGSIPSAGADNYNIKDNDKIIFYYSKSMEQEPPQWDDLEEEDSSGGGGGGSQSTSQPALVNEIVSQPGGQPFKDIAGHWAQKEIEFMAANGHVSGVGDNEFAPEIMITRAEFTAILVRMAGLTADPGGADCFSDVPAEAWYRGVVGAATIAGLINGTSEKSFAPDEPVTREQMAVMMVRFISKNGLDITISDDDTVQLLAGYSDSGDVSPWARTFVSLMTRERLITGRESGQFVPLGNTTRAEAAVVLYRVLQKLPQPGQ
ncbi:MAG: S-layer homology domain-containing protein [Desulfotomaculaceae bacterium]|nr:S-layer homology domain-containing protein [Desulfotomaculaceae bacterium]